MQILELTACSHVGLSFIEARNSHAEHKKSVGRIHEVRETGMGWCTHVRAGNNDIFFECSHQLKRRKYQHSAHQYPIRIKRVSIKKRK